MRTEFEKQKIRAMIRMSFQEMKLDVAQADADFINEELTFQLTSFIYQRTVEEREMVYYCPRPIFMDWLLRRKKRVVFNVNLKQVINKNLGMQEKFGKLPVMYICDVDEKED